MTTRTDPASTKPVAGDGGKEPSLLGRLLDPLDRFVEAIYTVLIILTFTLAVTVTEANVPNSVLSGLVKQLFWACFGCAIAWGLIDSAMYILSSTAGRGENLRLARRVRDAASEAEGVAAIADQLDESLSLVASEDERRQLYAGFYRRLQDAPLPHEAGFKREDLAGALGIFLVALGSALPVVLPLLIFSANPTLAVRLSNLVACIMLFMLGYSWARHAGGKPLQTGLFLVLLGLAMVLVAIPLGG
jgi:hypothetical protein